MYNHAHPLHKEPHKDTEKAHRITQERLVFEAMKGRPVTMLMASHATGVERANICRIVADLRKRGMIWKVYIIKCEITKHKAGYYTTDRLTALNIYKRAKIRKP